MRNEYPKRVVLKSGRTIELRPLKGVAGRDTWQLIHFLSKLPREQTEFLEEDVREPEVAEKHVAQRRQERVWSLLAIDGDGRVVGDATLEMGLHGWRRRVGEVRVVVDPRYTGDGVAQALIREVVDQATHRELRKLEAKILDFQIGARVVFEQIGFREEARLRSHATSRDDQTHDLIILTSNVDDLWHEMEEMILEMDFARERH
jgi:RimJ/RimL family protein N-acetyltransferase